MWERSPMPGSTWKRETAKRGSSTGKWSFFVDTFVANFHHVNTLNERSIITGVVSSWYTEAKLAKVKQKTKVRRFKAHYGSNPKVYAELFETLQSTNITAAKLNNPSMNAFDKFMMTLYFLKTYPTEKELNSRFGHDEKTARKWTRFFIDKISSLLPEKVIWPTQWNTTFIISVDCVNFGTNETRHPTLH